MRIVLSSCLLLLSAHAVVVSSTWPNEEQEDVVVKEEDVPSATAVVGSSDIEDAIRVVTVASASVFTGTASGNMDNVKNQDYVDSFDNTFPLRSPFDDDGFSNKESDWQDFLNELGQGWMDVTKNVPVVFEQEKERQGGEGGADDARLLDEKVTPINVALTCSGYNQHSSGSYNCSCSRVGKFDVYIQCKINSRLYNSDNTTYWEQRFTSILDGVQASIVKEFVPSSAFTTCTQQFDLNTTDLNTVAKEYVLSHETCIEVQPRTPGLFNGSFLCGASLDGGLCRSCRQCNANPPLRNTSASLSVDCCNRLKDGYMTCGFIDNATGLTMPQWDPVGTHQGCDGSGAVATSLATHGILLTWLLVVGTGMKLYL